MPGREFWWRTAAILAALLATAMHLNPPDANAEASRPTYAADVAFLRAHTEVIELAPSKDAKGPKVAVCPAYQGRVMTSTCGGTSDSSFGWINRPFITAGKQDDRFNNYGGEDRFWLAPEGGPFALFFAPKVEQKLANWFTPPGLNVGKFAHSWVDGGLRMTHHLELVNYADTHFQLDVERIVRLVDKSQFGTLFGAEAGQAFERGPARMVGFETDNTITNAGPAMTKEGGLVSLWILGMFHPGPQTVIILPYKAGDEAKLGPIVISDYFGTVPPERLKVTDKAVSFHGDGKFRSKIGIPPGRVLPIAGSMDFTSGVLTLVHFTLPEDPAGQLYVDNTWRIPQPAPFGGDVLNSYNDGVPEEGVESLGGFYELETLSPALPLAKGQSLRHVHRTIHIEGSPEALRAIAKATLGVDLAQVRRQMFPQ